LNNLCYNLYEGEGGSLCLWRGQCVAMHTDLTGRQTFWLQRAQNRTDSHHC